MGPRSNGGERARVRRRRRSSLLSSRSAAKAALVSIQPIRPGFDGKWMWADSNGRLSRGWTLFDGLFGADNPFLPRLEPAYRMLALRMRDGQCVDTSCVFPKSPTGPLP